jgi:hypothetical protein
MPYISPEERRNTYRQALGNDAGECLRLLENKLYSIRRDWLVYKGMFGTSESRVDILNSISGLVTWTVERTMWDSIALRLAHFADPTGGKDETLSLDRLTHLVHTDNWSDADREAYRTKRKYVRRLLGEFEPIRNKVLAHADYEVVANGYQGIYRASRSHIDDTIRNLEELLDLIRKASGLMTIVNDIVDAQIEEAICAFFGAIAANDDMDTENEVIG